MEPYPESAATPVKSGDLVENTHSASDVGGPGRTLKAEFRKESPAEDQDWIQNDVDEIGQPQGPHGNSRVPRTAKNRVDQKEPYMRIPGQTGH